MKINKHILVRLINVTAVAVMLSACGGGGGDAPATAGGEGSLPTTTTTIPTTTTTTPVTTTTTPVTTITTPGATTTVPTTTTTTPTVTPVTVASGDKVTETTAFLARFDQSIAAAPSSVAGFYELDDSCSKSNGYTKAYNVQYAQANALEVAGSNQYRIGSTRTLTSVTAERNITNADGTTRRELDIRFDILFADNSVDKDATNTIVSGSTSGVCATPTTAVEWRTLGNQRNALIGINALNDLTSAERISDGATFPSSISTRRALDFIAQDVQGLFTYAVVSGPGTVTISGVANPFSLKLISPRLLRDAPELAGKRSNYSNYTERNNFRACIVPAVNSSGPAPLADCVGSGAVGSSWGSSHFPNLTVTTVASADAQFSSYGFQVGGVYTFAFFNDDGWKTINGQQGKTPALTRTFTLQTLPYTHAEMLPTFSPTKFPVSTSQVFSAGANFSAVVNLTAPGTLSGTWTAPSNSFSDSAIFRLGEVGEYFEGSNVGTDPALIGAYPRSRYFTSIFPGPLATNASASLTPKPSAIIRKSYAEISLNYTDRNQRRIRLFTVAN